MTCPELEDRLFDEDCRSALLGRGDVPPDVADHLALCPRCAQEWSQAAAETGRLSHGLLVGLPPDLRDSLCRAFRTRAGGRAPVVDSATQALSRAIAFGALGAGLASNLPGLSAGAAFAIGASLGLAAAAVRRTGWIRRAPVAELLRILKRCLAQLAPVA